MKTINKIMTEIEKAEAEASEIIAQAENEAMLTAKSVSEEMETVTKSALDEGKKYVSQKIAEATAKADVMANALLTERKKEDDKLVENARKNLDKAVDVIVKDFFSY